MNRTVYEPVWKCIYCGDEVGPFQTEHVVPRGLGGSHILPRSTCERCRKETKKLDDHALREVFGRLRIGHNIHTDHPKERPNAFSIWEGDKEEREIVITAQKLPKASWALPLWGPPGILLNKKPNETWAGAIDARVEAGDAKSVLATGSGRKPVRFHLNKVSPHLFARWLAKIAHGIAVGELGYGAFMPLLPEFIRFGSQYPSYLVGCPSRNKPPPASGIVRVAPPIVETDTIDNEYLVVGLRFFAHLGTPDYKIVVGKRLDG